MGSMLRAIVIASSSSPDCVIDTSSYSATSASSAVSMSSSGNLSIATSAAFKSPINTVSVVVGSQTKESSPFSLEVFDCTALITFASLKMQYVG